MRNPDRISAPFNPKLTSWLLDRESTVEPTTLHLKGLISLEC